MSYTATQERFTCVVCLLEHDFDRTLPYHVVRVCGRCVGRLAHSYLMKHTGRPDQIFCTEEQWQEYLNSAPKNTERRAPSYWRERRLQVAARDGFVCHYCKKDVGVKKFTVDHIIPVSRGGTDDLSNLVGCCKSCNSSKHARDYDDFVGAAR